MSSLLSSKGFWRSNNSCCSSSGFGIENRVSFPNKVLLAYFVGLRARTRLFKRAHVDLQLKLLLAACLTSSVPTCLTSSVPTVPEAAAKKLDIITCHDSALGIASIIGVFSFTTGAAVSFVERIFRGYCPQDFQNSKWRLRRLSRLRGCRLTRSPKSVQPNTHT